ncbi:hypothetical protein Salat_1974200 [Sesamum alatum]|uniref:Uncharacterized protein n=1 Tax=Sesamum alatum TaxID=300844 RepID=A0AAE1Y6B7_9LAMI|nr:hypothetical protein Salat_1974200 [Sesamum alatum]
MNKPDLRILLNKKRSNENVGGVPTQPTPDGQANQPLTSSDGGSQVGAAEAPADSNRRQRPEEGQSENSAGTTMPELETVEDPKGCEGPALAQGQGTSVVSEEADEAADNSETSWRGSTSGTSS